MSSQTRSGRGASSGAGSNPSWSAHWSWFVVRCSAELHFAFCQWTRVLPWPCGGDVDEQVGAAGPGAGDLAGGVFVVENHQRDEPFGERLNVLEVVVEGAYLVGGAAAFHAEVVERAR